MHNEAQTDSATQEAQGTLCVTVRLCAIDVIRVISSHMLEHYRANDGA
jgi:hypothetical protein